MMTEDDIARIRSLADRASRGPWQVGINSLSLRYHPVPIEIHSPVVRLERTRGSTNVFTAHPVASVNESDDARFIAEARSAVPMLLDEIERLRLAIRTLGEVCGDTTITNGDTTATLSYWTRKTLEGNPKC